MSNEEILEKAIQKAIDGGWDVFSTENHQIDIEMITIEMLEDAEHYHAGAPHTGLTVYIRRNGYYAPAEVIFDHEFAQALWPDPDGEDEPHTINGNNISLTAVYYWQYHLREMVISPDPIQYLKDNLRD